MVSSTASNLSASCRARGLRFGVVTLTGGLVLAVLLAKLGVPWAWRLLLVVPFYLAANGFLQGLYGT